MQVLISNIKIPERIRKDMGNLDSLMESMERCGQLNPITITREMELVAGHRRLTAAQRLGWKMIDATVVDGITEARRVEIELEENIYRKDFAPEELLEGLKKLEELRHPKLGTRIKRAFSNVFGKLAFWRRKKPKQEAAEAAAQPPAQYAEPKSDDEPGNYGV